MESMCSTMKSLVYQVDINSTCGSQCCGDEKWMQSVFSVLLNGLARIGIMVRIFL